MGPTICVVALVCGVVLVCLLPFAASTDCLLFRVLELCNCIYSAFLRSFCRALGSFQHSLAQIGLSVNHFLISDRSKYPRNEISQQSQTNPYSAGVGTSLVGWYKPWPLFTAKRRSSCHRCETNYFVCFSLAQRILTCVLYFPSSIFVFAIEGHQSSLINRK